MTLILTSYKMVGQAHVTKILNHIKQGKEHYPELVAGYDMVNEEEFTPLISEFMPSILGAQRTVGVTQNMATFFHAGETHDRTITNMHDAVLLNSKRLGHGFQLALFPNLFKRLSGGTFASRHARCQTWCSATLWTCAITRCAT